MLMVIDYALQAGDNDAFVIEEPEQNLFPQKLIRLQRSAGIQ